jgi:hypothetical protein
LSIAVKSYLDELYNDSDPAVPINPTSPEVQARIKHVAAERYFPQSTHLIEDLHIASGLWDAVYEGVKNSGNTLKESEKKYWAETNEWVQARR